MGGERLKHSHHFASQTNGKHGDRANAEIAAHIQIYARVILGVCAHQGAGGAHAFAGKARLGIKLCAQCGSALTGAGVAEHEVALAEGNGGSAGEGEHLRLFRDQAQFGVEGLSRRIGRRWYACPARSGALSRPGIWLQVQWSA